MSKMARKYDMKLAPAKCGIDLRKRSMEWNALAMTKTATPWMVSIAAMKAKIKYSSTLSPMSNWICCSNSAKEGKVVVFSTALDIPKLTYLSYLT